LYYKEIGTDEWSEPVVAFDGRYVNDTVSISARGSFMPSIVPSIDKVPITATMSMDQTFRYAVQGTLHPMAKYTFECYQQGLLIIADPTKVSIEEKEDSDVFSLGNAWPNPATNLVNFEFSLQKAGNAKLEIFSSMGQKMATVFDKFCEAKVHVFNGFNTESFPTGAYYYKLTSGSVVETKMFNVIR
jgi:hypothetical protein